MKKLLLFILAIVLISYSIARADEIHDASIRGDVPRVKAILRSDPGSMNAKTITGETPLHLAARQGRTEVVRLLIEYGADVNAKDKNAETPLHEAAAMNQSDVAGILIKSGANINAKDKNGMTPLKFAIIIDNKEVTELLKAHGAHE